MDLKPGAKSPTSSKITAPLAVVSRARIVASRVSSTRRCISSSDRCVQETANNAGQPSAPDAGRNDLSLTT